MPSHNPSLNPIVPLGISAGGGGGGGGGGVAGAFFPRPLIRKARI